MATPLGILQTYLAGAYKRVLNADLIEIARIEARSDQQATWQWQDANLNATSPGSATGALILDQQIALCLYVQMFGDTTDLKAQLARALAIRSELRPRRQVALDGADELGEWAVSVLWLMEPSVFSKWITEIADLRQETSHFEEVSADALVNSGNDWKQSCEAHGVPRLLLQVRSALKKRELDQAMNWIGAEDLIVDRLRQITVGLPQALSRYVSDLNGALEKGVTAAALRKRESSAVRQIGELKSIAIENFRNIRKLNIELRSTTDLVEVDIIQGPNGSGKSSVSEAIAIGTSKVSSRYLDFLADTNEIGQNKAARYIERYLTPLAGGTGKPKIGLNGDPVDVELIDPNSAAAQCDLLSGTCLSQSWSENLLRIRATELGAQIAGNYSAIVGDVIDFIERRQSEAEAERATFNREWGLRANVSRDETARFRIADNVGISMMPVARSSFSWLETGSTIDWKFRTTFDLCVSQWKQWDANAQARAQDLARASDLTAITEILRGHLQAYNRLSQVVAGLQQSIENVRNAISEIAPDIEAQVDVWCRWLDSRGTAVEPVPPGAEIMKAKVNDLQKNLEAIARRGKAAAERVKQIQGIQGFLRDHWASEHPNDCPVCNSDVTKRNGILIAVQETERQAQSEILSMRTEYTEAKAELEAVSVQLRESDAYTPPFEGEGLLKIREAIRMIMGDEGYFDRLSEGRIRAQLREALSFLKIVPPAAAYQKSEEELEKLGTQGSTRLWNAYVRFLQVSEAPDAWKRILAKVYEELTATIREHMPHTLQALWWELARNIMPAPWQYPGVVEIQVDHRRLQAEAKVVVKGPLHSALAAHILNGAELHNLGLAWFFTRYLTFGRFVNSFLVLDDPAHQMDQPTFRDLCRLLAALSRIHRIEKIAVTLVLFLHQDDRAIDAARLTNGVLHLLRWHGGTAAIENRYRMRVSPVVPLKPYQILQA